MSYFIQDKNAQVYGNYIERLSEILKSYSGEYEVSLSISIFQSILLILKENVIYETTQKSRQNKNHKRNIRGINILDNIQYAERSLNKKVLTANNIEIFGFDKKYIKHNSLYKGKGPTFKDILTSLRNALAHPRSYPVRKIQNGFSVIQGDKIEEVVFTNIDRKDADKYIEIAIPVKTFHRMAIKLSEFIVEFLGHHDNDKKLSELLEKYAA